MKVPEHFADSFLKGLSTFYITLELFIHLLIFFLHYKPLTNSTLSELSLSSLHAEASPMPCMY